MMVSEDVSGIQIPESLFNNNTQGKKGQFLQPVGAMSPGGLMNMHLPMSPNADFCMRDNQFKQQANNSYANALSA